MLNVTIKFTVYCVFPLILGCNSSPGKTPEPPDTHYSDSISEWRIDSAYTAIKRRCDTFIRYRVPVLVDSLKKDSSLLKQYFDSSKLFTDADKKVERVVRQLLADCDSSLLKETYRRARQLQKSRPKKNTKAKT